MEGNSSALFVLPVKRSSQECFGFFFLNWLSPRHGSVYTPPSFSCGVLLPGAIHLQVSPPRSQGATSQRDKVQENDVVVRCVGFYSHHHQHYHPALDFRLTDIGAIMQLKCAEIIFSLLPDLSCGWGWMRNNNRQLLEYFARGLLETQLRRFPSWWKRNETEHWKTGMRERHYREVAVACHVLRWPCWCFVDGTVWRRFFSTVSVPSLQRKEGWTFKIALPVCLCLIKQQKVHCSELQPTAWPLWPRPEVVLVWGERSKKKPWWEQSSRRLDAFVKQRGSNREEALRGNESAQKQKIGN